MSKFEKVLEMHDEALDGRVTAYDGARVISTRERARRVWATTIKAGHYAVEGMLLFAEAVRYPGTLSTATGNATFKPTQEKPTEYHGLDLGLPVVDVPVTRCPDEVEKPEIN